MIKPISTVALLAIAVTGCSRASPESKRSAPAISSNGNSTATTRASGADADSANHRMLAAAEPFENLTEGAFSANANKLDSLIQAARAAAQSVLPAMSSAPARALRTHLDAIDAARKTNDRASIALAAVEGYRTLVSATSGPMAVPRQVSLLDYAGFRMQADLKASPQRWADVADAAAFANARWREIANDVADKTLAKKMDSAIAGITTAAKTKNGPELMKISTAELDLVDGLEQYFTRTAGGARHG